MTRPAAKIAISSAITFGGFITAAVISILAAGVGHGSYIPMGLFFPYGMFAAEVSHDLNWTVPVLGGLKVAIYAAVFGRGWIRGHPRKIGFRIAICHAVAACGFLLMYVFL